MPSSTPCAIPREGSSGVEDTFQTSTRPSFSSNRQISVNVPPESTPTRQRDISDIPISIASQLRKAQGSPQEMQEALQNRLYFLKNFIHRNSCGLNRTIIWAYNRTRAKRRIRRLRSSRRFAPRQSKWAIHRSRLRP